MALRNASRPGRTAGPVTPDQLARLRAQLANGQAAQLVEVRWSDLANVVHDLDVLARLRQVATRAIVPAAEAREIKRADHQVRDEARD